jgi:tyrosine-specific transport protein
LFQRRASSTEEVTSEKEQSTDVSTVIQSNSWIDSNIDSSRFLFIDAESSPERLLSALEYSPQANQMRRNEGSVWGSAALVAGTTVGAGVLALPAATVSAGFLPSTTALLVAWVIMTASGLFIAELTLNRWVTTGKPGLGLLELFDSLGNPWKTIGSAAYFFLHYAMMVAYIAQGGVNVDFLLPENVSGPVVFAALTSSGLFLASSSIIEQTNNIMVLGVAAAFVAIVAVGANSADWSLLVTQANPSAVLSCFPILLLALVYQNIVPTVVQQLEGDRRKITLALTTGTIIPLIMFIAWNAVVLANVPQGVTDVDPLALLQQDQNMGVLGPLVTTFSTLALLTSIIGFTYGLLDAWTDVLQWRVDQLKPSNKLALFALIYVPPTLLSLFNPAIFFQALDYGGAFGVSTLFLVLPPLLIWQERYQRNTPLATPPLVPGGKVSVAAILSVATVLILQQGVEKFGPLFV